MTAKLDARQLVPLTSEELDALREAAKVAEITPGLYSRALMGHAMALAAAGDPAIDDAVAAEKGAAGARITAGARAAVAQRWNR